MSFLLNEWRATILTSSKKELQLSQELQGNATFTATVCSAETSLNVILYQVTRKKGVMAGIRMTPISSHI